MIVKSEAAMVPELKELWLRCFMDTAEDVEYFFKYRHKSCECLTDVEDGRVAAMAFLLPAAVEGTKQEAVYLYAFATHPDWQGKGIATRLLRAVREKNRAAGRLTVLCPADDRLVGFYEKRGFAKRYFAGLQEGVLHTEDGKGWMEENKGIQVLRVADCGVERYADARRACLMPGDICWDTAAVRYALEENRHSGGACFSLLFSDSTRGAALARREDETLCLRELLLCREDSTGCFAGKEYATAAAEAVAAYWSRRMPGTEAFRKWRAYLPDAEAGKTVLMGMADEAGACGYMNLLLD